MMPKPKKNIDLFIESRKLYGKYTRKKALLRIKNFFGNFENIKKIDMRLYHRIKQVLKEVRKEKGNKKDKITQVQKYYARRLQEKGESMRTTRI